MRCAGNDLLVCRHLGRNLHRHIRLALVVEHHELVFVFRFWIGVAEPDREVRGIAAADTVYRDAAGERTDEADFDFVLGFGVGRADRKDDCRDTGRYTVSRCLTHTPSMIVFARRFSQCGHSCAGGALRQARIMSLADACYVGLGMSGRVSRPKKKGGCQAALFSSE